MEGPSVDVPEEFKKDAKVGLADRILQAKEEERKRLKAIEDKKNRKASKGKGKEKARYVLPDGNCAILMEQERGE